jgi:hypothetical protein
LCGCGGAREQEKQEQKAQFHGSLTGNTVPDQPRRK